MAAEKPTRETCPGIDGLLKEKKAFAKEKPSDEILDFYNLGAAQKTERYEITAYENLIDMADALGRSAVVTQLETRERPTSIRIRVVRQLAGEVGREEQALRAKLPRLAAQAAELEAALVALDDEMIRAALGEPLSFGADQLVSRGHAIECRINAEDPDKDFAPAAGRLETYVAPGGPGTRVDSHCYPGWTIAPFYDSLIAKLIVWAPSREGAIERMDLPRARPGPPLPPSYARARAGAGGPR